MVYGYTTLELGQNPRLSGSRENQSSLSRSHGWIKVTLKRKTRQTSLINENSVLEHRINNELTAQNNKCDIEIFPPGYETIDAISSGDRIGSTWWSVIACTLEFCGGYNHKQVTFKNTECSTTPVRSNRQPIHQLTTD